MIDTNTMYLNNKEIDTNSVEIEDVDPRDFPDFCDAYISYAEFKDGTPLNDSEIDELNQNEGEWINLEIHDNQLYA